MGSPPFSRRGASSGWIRGLTRLFGGAPRDVPGGAWRGVLVLVSGPGSATSIGPPADTRISVYVVLSALCSLLSALDGSSWWLVKLNALPREAASSRRAFSW